MLHSLWFRLSICFTLITFFSICFLNLIPYPVFVLLKFDEVITPKAIYEAVLSEQLVLAEAINKSPSAQWAELATVKILQKTINIESHEGDNFSEFLSINLYVRAFNNEGQLAFSQPASWSLEAETVFDKYKTDYRQIVERAESLESNNHIWLAVPVKNESGKIQGYMDLFFIINCNYKNFFQFHLINYLKYWYVALTLLSVVGFMCGLVASYFVTNRLITIDKSTAMWSKGDFTTRILINSKSKDVLTEHSRRLNIMANELESLLDLRQQIAVTEERNRMAREPHDTVKQNLFALKLQLAVIRNKNSNDDIAPHLEEAEKITREAQQDLMEILTQLYQLTSLKNGFYGRLEALAEDMHRRFEIEFIWHQKTEIKLNPQREISLIRLAQEAVSNAARHGRATKIIMSVYRLGQNNYWLIADNGKGLPATNMSLGLGLIFMEERAKELPEGNFQ